MEVTLEQLAINEDRLIEAYALMEEECKLKWAIKNEEEHIGPLCTYYGVNISGWSFVLHGEDWFRGEKWQSDSDHDFEEEILTDFDNWKQEKKDSISKLETDHAKMLIEKERRHVEEKEAEERKTLDLLQKKYGENDD